MPGCRSENSNPMQIQSAEFVMSNSKVTLCPDSRLPEYAFIGRSNVGKSSLINMLTGKKSLAKTSSTPGKTQLINHFLINKKWHLVDLPGYGYAKVSVKARKKFQSFITDYFLKRPQLVAAFVLVDVRHPPQQIDLDFLEWLGENQIPFYLVFTKADKLSKLRVQQHVDAYKKQLLSGSWAALPEYFVTSATDKTGREEILQEIDRINTSFNTHKGD